MMQQVVMLRMSRTLVVLMGSCSVPLSFLASRMSISWSTRDLSDPSGKRYLPFPINLTELSMPISEASRRKK